MWVRSRSARSVEIVETSSDESAERSPGVFLAELPIEAVGISMGLWVGGSSSVFRADWFVEAVGWSLDWWFGGFRTERFGCSLGLRVGGSFGVFLVDWFVEAVGWSFVWWVEGCWAGAVGVTLGLWVGGSSSVFLVDLFFEVVGWSFVWWVEGSFGETSELSLDWELEDFSVAWVVGWVGGLRWYLPVSGCLWTCQPWSWILWWQSLHTNTRLSRSVGPFLDHQIM